MLGRRVETNRLIVNQAGARPLVYNNITAPQNNQVLDANYGQSISGQVPIHVYKPYYPKIETVLEKKITPKDIFKSQSEEVQKLISSAKLSRQILGVPSTTPVLGKPDQQSTAPSGQESDVRSFATASQGTFEPDWESSAPSPRASQVDSRTTVSINDMIDIWDAMLEPIPTNEIVSPPFETTETLDSRIENEIEDDRIEPPRISRRPPMIQTGMSFRPVFAPVPQNQYTRGTQDLPEGAILQRTSRAQNIVNTIPQSARTSPVVVNSFQDLMEQISSNARPAQIQEAIEEVTESVREIVPDYNPEQLQRNVAQLSPSTETAVRIIQEENIERLNTIDEIRRGEGLPPMYRAEPELLPRYSPGAGEPPMSYQQTVGPRTSTSFGLRFTPDSSSPTSSSSVTSVGDPYVGLPRPPQSSRFRFTPDSSSHSSASPGTAYYEPSPYIRRQIMQMVNEMSQPRRSRRTRRPPTRLMVNDMPRPRRGGRTRRPRNPPYP